MAFLLQRAVNRFAGVLKEPKSVRTESPGHRPPHRRGRSARRGPVSKSQSPTRAQAPPGPRRQRRLGAAPSDVQRMRCVRPPRRAL